ncbi:MAG TPA: chemotaxis protein [Acetomicrobium flavidum]|uniref:Chemotaxis signal transduction protein n=2 Tax=Acetomicrobium TaxID=49894 RepID=I4BYI2_ACEMN|nr:chemotaxis protein [Acetomicrobium mobile]NLG94291.1 chemotaxis protein CheV [Acetomicrobium flavidum]AFM22339.1 chemotaxis signal transduction protein [Acetomicrobium mobile DSM 13181]SIN71491.1 two-component system, chemotaxis family, response regulator CheV [Acetomicrobium flavidum]HOJ81983.1 chemotaxis protein [Acetomicrobium flavidum]HOM31049.1 chemotaxis protein [Acetomicrobium flavidum]
MREDRIMTEVGTNEWQVVVFTLGDQSFAINVDKTREILRWTGVRPVPQSHPAMLGITTVRGEVIPLIDLRIYLNITPAVPLEQSKVIVTEFNQMKLGFVVDGVERIYRIHSEELDATLTGTFLGENVLYVIKRDERNILLLDYERIVQVVNPQLAGQYQVDSTRMHGAVSDLGDLDQYKILVVEDSPLIRKMIQDVLAKGGFHNVEAVSHGKAAWDRLCDEGEAFDLVITDIEMPKMDGLALTKKIKEDERLRNIPVIVFSSIMADDIKKKAQSVGADGQITKPEIEQLIAKVGELLRKRREVGSKNHEGTASLG